MPTMPRTTFHTVHGGGKRCQACGKEATALIMRAVEGNAWRRQLCVECDKKKTFAQKMKQVVNPPPPPPPPSSPGAPGKKVTPRGETAGPGTGTGGRTVVQTLFPTDRISTAWVEMGTALPTCLQDGGVPGGHDGDSSFITAIWVNGDTATMHVAEPTVPLSSIKTASLHFVVRLTGVGFSDRFVEMVVQNDAGTQLVRFSVPADTIGTTYAEFSRVFTAAELALYKGVSVHRIVFLMEGALLAVDARVTQGWLRIEA